jgi:hypothetical protein
MSAYGHCLVPEPGDGLVHWRDQGSRTQQMDLTVRGECYIPECLWDTSMPSVFMRATGSANVEVVTCLMCITEVSNE